MGLSQEQLWEIIGIKRSIIAGYEQGWLNPSQKILIKNVSRVEMLCLL